MTPEELAKAFVTYNTSGPHSVKVLQEQLEYFLLHYGDAEILGKDVLMIKSENKIRKEAEKIVTSDDCGLSPRPIDSRTPEEIKEIRRKANG